jgi:tRNA (cytidine32/uridine32-2'-O)-methyltransferase
MNTSSILSKQQPTQSLLASIRIVLIQTHHPGNIGAVARSMKTMGLTELYLVKPEQFPHQEASSRAAGASDLLNNAVVVDNLDEATGDCSQVFATTARQKHAYSGPQNTCEEAVEWVKANPKEKIAIVFGRERTGLSAEQINACQQVLYIPGNPEYDVLNMAAAVQIVCYELRKQLVRHHNTTKLSADTRATQDNLRYFYQDLQLKLEASGYLKKKNPGDTIKRIRQFINGANPTEQDIAMLRGLINALTRRNTKSKIK